jgi:hypothetical protein
MAVLYTFNALPTPRAWRGHDEPDLGVSRTHGHALEVGGPSRLTRLAEHFLFLVAYSLLRAM